MEQESGLMFVSSDEGCTHIIGRFSGEALDLRVRLTGSCHFSRDTATDCPFQLSLGDRSSGWMVDGSGFVELDSTIRLLNQATEVSISSAGTELGFASHVLRFSIDGSGSGVDLKYEPITKVWGRYDLEPRLTFTEACGPPAGRERSNAQITFTTRAGCSMTFSRYSGELLRQNLAPDEALLKLQQELGPH
jgi:hypothetical protein